jgi:phosphoserine phosphatase
MSSAAHEALNSHHLSRVIFEYAGLIGREQDREALLSLIANMGRDLVDADRCSIWLVDEASGHLVTKLAQGTDVIRIEKGRGLVGQCVESGEVVLSNDLAKERRFGAHIDAKTGYHTRSVLVVPMRSADGTVIGAFQALNKPGGFARSDADLLGLAAAYSATTIESQQLLEKAAEARRLQRDLEIAHNIQQQLLPQTLPKTDYFQLCPVTMSTRTVGGDYYDVIPLPGDRFGIAVADVSGKGLPAAMMAATVQGSFSAVAAAAPDLEELFGRINNFLCQRTPPDMYATMFYGVVNRAGRLAYLSAGHPTTLVLRAGGKVERLDSPNFPIGLLRDVSFDVDSVRLDPGDSLIVYSDGVTEAEDPRGGMFGEGRLIALLEGQIKPDPRSLSDRIIGAINDYAAGAPQSDDITVVVLRFGP